ncbi:hypothetical protein [Halobellus rarus]|uniref:DUF8149 domain-containing protein n=1 Tax=Halobellus rarus TaxID=1126237 RepID=A0ABD6CQ40_9EURY|nr:hypothetical protein [Halobellus rarus]
MTDEETDDEPTVPIVCEDCGTTSRVPLSELRESIDTHNEHRHDGEEIAQVDPVLADALADAVADDLGLLDAE